MRDDSVVIICYKICHRGLVPRSKYINSCTRYKFRLALNHDRETILRIYSFKYKTYSVLHWSNIQLNQKNVWAHNELVEGFTKTYHIHELMYYEIHNDINEAIKREKIIKKWKRDWKWNIIDKINPERKNLFVNNDIVSLQIAQ